MATTSAAEERVAPERVRAAIEEISEALGADRVETGADELRRHGTDESWHPTEAPDAVVAVRSTEEVVAVVRACHAHDVPLIAFGAGSALEGHVQARRGGISVDLTPMDAIGAPSLEDLDVRVQAGVTRRALEDRLRPQGVFFSVDPGADATIGGMIATGASGTTAVRYGTIRHNVLSLTVVLADGTVVKTGGRARKSSAGYDLTRLFIGSEGTLGIVTEAVLRLQPNPEAATAAVCAFATLKGAVDCAIGVMQLGIPVARVELLDEMAVDAVNRHSDLDNQVAPTLFFEFTGSEQEVTDQAEEAAAVAAEHGGQDFQWAADETERRRLWHGRHHFYEASKALRPGCKAFSTDACVPVSRLTEMIVESREDLDESGLMGAMVGHVGDGNFHVGLLLDPDDEDERERAIAYSDRLVKRAIAMEGTCTGEHGVGWGKSKYLELEHGPEAVALMRTIKAALDPKGILNPGKVAEGPS